MYANHIGYILLHMSGLLEHGNLIPQLALSNAQQSCTYELNPRDVEHSQKGLNRRIVRLENQGV